MGRYTYEDENYVEKIRLIKRKTSRMQEYLKVECQKCDRKE
jgi:hypothetical protein